MKIKEFYSGQGMLKTGLALILASAAATTPAMAEDYDFGGFHIEAITGYDNEGSDFEDNLTGTGGRDSQNGWLYGIGAGYDFDIDNWVLGVETELTESTASREERLLASRPPAPSRPIAIPVTGSTDVESGGDFYIGGKAGYVVAPQALIYAKFGYTHHKLKVEGSGLDGGVPFSFDQKVKFDGWRLGIGTEYQFTSNWFGRIEYRYTNYSSGDLDVRGAAASTEALFEGIDLTRHQVAIMAGYRF